MAKRYIGIDIVENELRLARAEMEKGELFVRRLEHHALEGVEDLAKIWRRSFGAEPAYGDRAAAAFPAAKAFFRRLILPFAEEDKVEAVLPNEMASRLPFAGDEVTVDFLKPRPSRDAHLVPSVAAATAAVRTVLKPFDDAAVPLYCLDLSPFAYASGLPEPCRTGLLAVVHGGEATVSRVVDGTVEDYRLLPALPSDRDAVRRFILQHSLLLERAGGYEGMPLYLIGDQIDETLAGDLAAAGRTAQIPHLVVDGTVVSAAFLPAVLLARRAAGRDRRDGFNLRRGSLARRSEWAAVASHLRWALGLLLLFLLFTGGSLGLGYLGKARQAQALQSQIVAVYQEAFPGKRVLKHQVLQQMKNELNALEKQARLLGVEGDDRALEILSEVSRLCDPQIDYALSEFTFSPEALRLEGEATTFDSVNRLARSLEGSELFAEVQIADAKMAADGSRIDFRLKLSLSTGEQP